MYRTSHIVAIIVALSISTLTSKAQTMLGLYSSPKGQGISLTVPDADAYALHSLVVYADMSSRLKSDSDFVGAMANYSRLIPLFKATIEDFDLYVVGGPGISLGYVADSGLNPGLFAALSGKLGLFFDFDRRVSLCLSSNVDLGFHVHSNQMGNIDLSFYRDGIIYSFIPQISILISL